MILSVDNHPGGFQLQAMYRSSSSSDKPAATLSKDGVIGRRLVDS